MRGGRLALQAPDTDTFEAHLTLRADPCAYCGRPRSGGIDHIVPVSDGGTDALDNLTGACASCNSGKSAKPLLEYLLYRCDWTAYEGVAAR